MHILDYRTGLFRSRCLSAVAVHMQTTEIQIPEIKK